MVKKRHLVNSNVPPRAGTLLVIIVFVIIIVMSVIIVIVVITQYQFELLYFI